MIKLPDYCGSRLRAEEIFAHPDDRALLVDATSTLLVAQGFMDETCKQLIQANVDSVTFLGASERMEELFLRAHRLRSAKFSVEFR